MHAYEIPNLRFSLPAAGRVRRYRFVSVSNEGAVQADATTQVIGASMNEVGKDEESEGRIVEIADGIVMVEASGAITSGAAVYADNSGMATATKGTGNVAGVAITAATAAGDLIAVKMF